MQNYLNKPARLLVGLLLGLSLGACSLEPKEKEDKEGGISLDDLGQISPPLGERSLIAFEQSVHKLVQEVTCKNCHANDQSPTFAAEDANAGHEQAIAAQIVDFDHPEESRLVLQLSENSHNCWTVDNCQQDADQMLAAITQWINLAKEEQEAAAQPRVETAPARLDTSSNQTGPWELTFDLSEHLNGTSASLEITVESLDEASYIFVNPTLVTANKTIKVQDIGIKVNGKKDKQAADFSVIDEEVAPPEAVLSTTAMLVGKDGGPRTDAFILSFGVLELKD